MERSIYDTKRAENNPSIIIGMGIALLIILIAAIVLFGNELFAGYSEDNLPNGSFFERFLTLAASFPPFDSLAIVLLAEAEAEAPYNPNRITLNITTAIQLVLDKAAIVEEAVALLK